MNYKIWFNMVRLKNKHKLNLIKYFKKEENILNYAFSKDSLDFLDTKEEEIVKFYLKKEWDREKYNNINKKLLNLGVKICSIYEKEYPKALLDFEDSPPVLYYLGDINKLNSNIAVSLVGSRKSSHYGKNITEIIAKSLSENNINIVSGLARGIDTVAHEICLENGGFTAGILGCGIDVVYPKENNLLFRKMAKGGVVISEFPPTTAPYAYNFPIRNRIISGLSNLVIVIEAGKKSGSLITATLALEQGKDVMAVPGSIFSTESKGTNKLIKEGAYPFTEIDDIFNILKINRIKTCRFKTNKMSNLETKVFDAINFNPIHIDEIFRITHIDIKQIYEVLFELQLKNEILCLPGNYYAKIIKEA